MNKVGLYILFLLCLYRGAYGQNNLRFHVSGTNSGCYISSLIVDKQNNIVVTGYYHKEKALGDTTGILEVNDKSYVLPGATGSFVAKFAQNKELLWLRFTPRNLKNIYIGAHVLLDDSRNIYVIGHFQRSLLAESGTGETFISKYSEDGLLNWEKVLGGITDNGEFKPEIDSEGNLYLLGKYQGDLRIDEAHIMTTKDWPAESYLLKLSNSGRVVLSKSFPVEVNLNAIAINTTNEILAVGDFQGDVQFEDGTILISAGLKDVFYTKYASNGQLVWVKTIGGKQDDECHHIKVDKSGNIFLAGVVSSEAQFNTLPVRVTEGERSIFLTKIMSVEGQPDWVRNMPFGGKSTLSGKHELVAGLELNEAGVPYIYGVVGSFLQINANTSLIAYTFPFYYLVKVESNGNFSYAKQYNVSGGYGFSYWTNLKFEVNDRMYIIGTDQNYNRLNGSRNDESFLVEKNEVNACNGATFEIERLGEILRPVEAHIGVYYDDKTILAENDFSYQWYKNGEKIANATEKILLTNKQGYYTLKLISKTDLACEKTSTNFVGVYSPDSGVSLNLSVDYNTNKLTTTPTIPGSTLEWYKNNQIISGQTANSIDYQPEGTYQVKERYQDITKESNELVFNAGIVVEIIKETYFQLGDHCRPGPYLKCNFVSDIPVEYQWYLNGNPVRDSTNNHFNPITTGEYQVSVYMPDKNRTYVSGKYKLVPADFPKSLPIVKVEDSCAGTALLKVDDAFMQKYQFRSIVWRLDGQDIPNVTVPYYRATKAGYYTFSVKYVVDSQSGECNYNSFVEFNKAPASNLNLGYAYAGSGCMVDSFKVFVEYNKNYSYAWTKNDTLLKNEQHNEIFIKDKGVYRAVINKGDGCISETEAISLKGCIPDSSNQFLILNPPIVVADKTTIFANEQSFLRTNGCANVNFQWLKDAEPIVGANQPDFEIKHSGTYRLQIEKSGCRAVSEPVIIVVENILSNETEQDLSIKVFPNPFSESLSIELPAQTNKTIRLILTDIAGKRIKSWDVESKHNLELADLAEGTYLLSFEINNKNFVKKIIKRK